MKLLFPCAFAVIASAQPLILSNNFASKPFAGIGGISGGGATSRSLFDYPESARSTLLNLLFSSQYGASFGHAKVEIPANADTTCGSEVAHRHDADDGGSCDRGYEGWFLQQATQRGVEITSSLQWAAPLFVGEEGVNGGKSLFTLTNIDQFVIPWLKCMKSAYNISLKFQGAGWNEHPHNNSYIKLMRSQLDSAGLSDIGLAASDECCGSNWNIAIDMASDPQLAAAVDVITTHVAGSLEENTPTPIEALTSGKPLSQGEEHIGMPDPDGVPIWEWAAAASVGIEINQNWVVNSMTSTVFRKDLKRKIICQQDISSRPLSEFYYIYIILCLKFTISEDNDELSKQSLTLAKEVMKFNIYITQRVDFQYGSQ